MNEEKAMEVFEKAPVFAAVLKNAVPAIAAMLMVLIYNLADTFFIGQTHDDLQVAAVSLAKPVFLIFMAVGTVFGIGGTSAFGSTIPTISLRTVRKSSPWLLLNAPTTFSHTANLGYIPLVAPRISLIILIASIKSSLRVVSSSPFDSCFNPALFPATLRSWHGEPKAIISTGSMSAPLIFVTSPRCFMCGKEEKE